MSSTWVPIRHTVTDQDITSLRALSSNHDQKWFLSGREGCGNGAACLVPGVYRPSVVTSQCPREGAGAEQVPGLPGLTPGRGIGTGGARLGQWLSACRASAGWQGLSFLPDTTRSSDTSSSTPLAACSLPLFPWRPQLCRAALY